MFIVLIFVLLAHPPVYLCPCRGLSLLALSLSITLFSVKEHVVGHSLCVSLSLRLPAHPRASLYTAFFRRGVARQSMGDLEGAVGDFDECRRLDASNTDAEKRAGVLRTKLGLGPAKEGGATGGTTGGKRTLRGKMGKGGEEKKTREKNGTDDAAPSLRAVRAACLLKVQFSEERKTHGGGVD